MCRMTEVGEQAFATSLRAKVLPTVLSHLVFDLTWCTLISCFSQGISVTQYQEILRKCWDHIKGSILSAREHAAQVKKASSSFSPRVFNDSFPPILRYLGKENADLDPQCQTYVNLIVKAKKKSTPEDLPPHSFEFKVHVIFSNHVDRARMMNLGLCLCPSLIWYE